MDFANPRGMSGVQEERGFTNPHVRFIRKNGKIIPIVNRKRIGQDVSSSGRSVMAKGAGILVAGFVAKKTGLAKKIPKFSIKGGLFKHSKSDKMKTKVKKAAVNTIYKGGKASISGLGSILRNSKKFGFGTMALGAAGVLAGDEMQMRSGFGKDFFFIKDRQGRYS